MNEGKGQGVTEFTISPEVGFWKNKIKIAMIDRAMIDGQLNRQVSNAAGAKRMFCCAVHL